MANKMDVIVVGSGPAGMIASVAAARSGAKVLLVERAGYLGGGMSAVETNYIGGWHNMQNREQVVKGIPEELVDQLKEFGATPGYVQEGNEAGEVPLDVELMKLVADDFVLDNGVNVLFHSVLCGTITEGNNLRKIEVANMAGKQLLEADVFIDATGDGDLVAFSGASYELSSREDQQMATMMFKMTHVDTDKLLAFAKETYGEIEGYSIDTSQSDIQVEPGMWVFGFKKILDDAREKAEREGKTSGYRSPVIAIGAVTGGEWVKDEYWMLNTDVPVDSSDPEDVTRLEIEGRRQIKALLPILKGIPGFQDARLSMIAPRAGIREGRRLVGEYTLTRKDVHECSLFDDVVAYGTHHIDVHGSEKEPGHNVIKMKGKRGIYDIPYRALVPQKLDGLLVAGRCISTSRYANYSTRYQAVCMGTGQAAGVAAALASSQGKSPRDVSVTELQASLNKLGASLDRE